MKIFISHSHADVDLARALADLFQKALSLSSKDIGCTSVDAHKLPPGQPVSQSIRKAIEESEAFVAIVTRHSLESVYVLFETGARWGKGRWLAPLIGPDLRAEDVPAPLSELNMAFSSNANALDRLVDEVAKQIGISVRKDLTYSDAVKRVTSIKRSSYAKLRKVVKLVILLATVSGFGVAWHFGHELNVERETSNRIGHELNVERETSNRLRTEAKKANSPVLVGSGTLIELMTEVLTTVAPDSNITPVTIDLGSTQSARPLVEAHNRGRDVGALRAPVISLSVASLDKLNWSSALPATGDAFYAVEVEINNPLEVVVWNEGETCGHVLQPEPSKEDLDHCFLRCIDGHKSCKVFSVTSGSGTRTQQGLAGFTFFKKFDDLQPPSTDLRAAGNGEPQDVYNAIAFGSALLHRGYHKHSKDHRGNVYQQCKGRWKRVTSDEPCSQEEKITAYLIGRYPAGDSTDKAPIPEVVCDLFESLDKASRLPHNPIIKVGKHPSRGDDDKSCKLDRHHHTRPFVWKVGAKDVDFLDTDEQHSRRNGVNLGQP